MATAKKTTSGMWKCRVYSHTDAEGKKHYRAFSAPSKQEAEQEAARFSASTIRAARVDLTVAEALDGFITARTGVLSPATVRGYRALEHRYYSAIGTKRLRRLTTPEVQAWISDLAAQVSPKTVSNIYGLLTAACAFYMPDLSFRIKLPSRQKHRQNAANSCQIIDLYNAASPNLQKAIALSAFTSMRRGEVCALLYGDIDGNIAHVHADLVRGVGGWKRKETPKTSDSDRFVQLPAAVLRIIGTGAPNERVVPISPDTITELFGRLRDSLGIQIRFQDLRHYFASIAAALNVPDTYTESMGGWRPGSHVMKSVYQNVIRPEADRYASVMTDHFDAMLAPDPKSMTQSMTQEKEKPLSTRDRGMTPTGIEPSQKTHKTP